MLCLCIKEVFLALSPQFIDLSLEKNCHVSLQIPSWSDLKLEPELYKVLSELLCFTE